MVGTFFILGLAVGSFLNVLVCRLKEGETLFGRSMCRHCQHLIRWYDNIPLVSFLILRGKCRDCKASFSWRYPMLELVTAVVFALVGYFYFDVGIEETWLETLWLLGVMTMFLGIAAYDMMHMEIPISLLIGVFVWTVLYFAVDFQGFVLSWSGREVQAFMGALVVGGFFFALVFASRETWMGWGDVWLGALAGGLVGLSGALFMMTLSFGVGAIVGIVLMLSGEKEMKSQLPFAPYLVIGTIGTLFFSKIFPEYLSLLLL